MKIAIQGHSTRGKEVIQIFKDLGTEGLKDHTGSHIDWIYLRDDSLRPNQLIVVTDIIFLKRHDYKVYTLEEFEKEFPFKIGDMVLRQGGIKPYEIIALELFMNKLCYRLDNGFLYGPKILTIYKKMKEERNITLTLDKAKEWFNKGGELKEIALQAFTEQELNPLPRSWEEFCAIYSKVDDKEYFIEADSNIVPVHAVVPNHCRLMNSDRNICPSKKSAEAHLAMVQLEQLRDCWRNGWVPNWSDRSEKWCIALCGNELSVSITTIIPRFLTFPTKEVAKEFLKCFRDLIEKAKDLI